MEESRLEKEKTPSRLSRRKPPVGLVFALPLADQCYGFGQIVARQDSVYYMAGFDHISEKPELPPDLLPGLRPVFLGNFFDILIRNGRWISIGVQPVGEFPFPCYKVKIGDHFYIENWEGIRLRVGSARDLDRVTFRTYTSPITLEDALRFHAGLGPHHTFYDPLRWENVVNSSKVADEGDAEGPGQDGPIDLASQWPR